MGIIMVPPHKDQMTKVVYVKCAAQRLAHAIAGAQ